MDEVFQALIQMVTPGSELSEIILLTLQMSAFSTVISTLIGVPLGVIVGLYRFPGKRLVMRILNTLMGLPPVLAGVIVYFLVSRSGPLGTMRLIYSLPAMVIAQVLLITPVVCGLSATAIAGVAPLVHETAHGMGLSRRHELKCLFYECRSQLMSLMFVAFGRSIGEVGAVSLVGGNVLHKTRVMTTAIMYETNQGHFGDAVALGVALLLVSFIINSIALSLQERTSAPETEGARSRTRSGKLGGGRL